jgi:hypothetical protein
MKTQLFLVSAAAAVVIGGLGLSAIADDDCHCNCYFSSDCEGSQWCNWGSLSVEDSCWWRTPKPEGVPGANCTNDYGNWGRCDGICTASINRSSVLANEDPATLRLGFATWSAALNEIALNGGGVPTAKWLRRIDEIEFNDPTMSDGIWRMAIEVFMLARGEDFVIYPEDGGATFLDVAVADISDDPVAQRNGDLAVKAVLAEIDEAGTGMEYVREIDPETLDHDLFGRICDDLDLHECLYERLAVIGDVLGRNDRGVIAGATCPGCSGDCVHDDQVDVADLLALLDMWGAGGGLCSDVDNSGTVDVFDLLQLLDNWGPCAPPL